MRDGEMTPYVRTILTFYLLFQISNAISPHPLLLVISLDGFWSGYLDEYNDVMPNLRDIAKTGVYSPWMENVFITKTLPNHQTIATGLYEENHGIVANTFFDPILNDTFTPNLGEAKWWDTGPIPIWILNQMAGEGRVSGGMMWPGTQASIKNQTALFSEPYSENVNNTKLSEQLIKSGDEVIKWMTDKDNPANLVLFYFPEPDLTGHMHGPNSSEMKNVLSEIDQGMGKFRDNLKDAGLYDRLNMIIVSDHGMAEVIPERIIVLDKILNHSYTVFGNSPVYAVYPDQGKEDFVYGTFKNASARYNFTINIFKKEDIPDEYHYKLNARIPPYLLLAEEGYDILPLKDKENMTGPYGNHGYNNTLKSMHAIFIAHGPAFKSGVTVSPIKNIDLYPLMCHILNLIPDKSNGSLALTLNVMRNPFGVHVTNKWLVVVCSILGICILVAVVSALFVNKKGEYEDNKGMASKMMNARQNRSGEENTYLLLTSSADEV